MMLNLNFSPFPNLETERLWLRRIDKSHKTDLFAIRGNEDAMKYLDRPLAKVEDDVLELLGRMDKDIDNNDGISWGLFLKGSSQLIGTIGYYRTKKENYRGEIGYLLLPSFWRMAIMSEAMKEVLRFGFEVIKYHSIEADINPSNQASAAILKKFNFVEEAHFKENVFYNGQFLDTAIYSLLKKNWIQNT